MKSCWWKGECPQVEIQITPKEPDVLDGGHVVEGVRVQAIWAAIWSGLNIIGT
jgi:hypothetical protein